MNIRLCGPQASSVITRFRHSHFHRLALNAITLQSLVSLFVTKLLDSDFVEAYPVTPWLGIMANTPALQHRTIFPDTVTPPDALSLVYPDNLGETCDCSVVRLTW